MSVSDPRHCPECGSDTYFAQNFGRMRDKAARLEDEIRRMAARHAVEKANWELKEIEREVGIRFIQGKAHRQLLALNQLEKRLRDLGHKPYEVDGA